MIYVDIETCDKIKYFELLKYIFSECNRVTFHFPNFLNTGLSDIKLDSMGRVNNEYIEYLKLNESLINISLIQGGTKEIKNVYNGIKLGYNTQIINTKLSKEIKTLLNQQHIYNWIFPDLPEDICFFNNNICRFASESHEQLFFISNEKNEDISFLKKYGFDFMVKKRC